MIEGQRRDVRLAGFIPELAHARGVDAINVTRYAGADKQRSIGRSSNSPDVFRFGSEHVHGLAAFEPHQLAVGRRCRIDAPIRRNRDREYFGLIRIPHHGRSAVRRDAVNTSAIAGARIDGTVRRGRQAPDCRLAGGEHRRHLRRQHEAAIAVQRDAIETPAHQILPGIQFPRSSGRALDRQRGGERQEQGPHSFTSTCTVFDPLITLSPPSISISARPEPRNSDSTPGAPWLRARINASEGGGSGRSVPCT